MFEITKPKVIFCDLDNYQTLSAVKSSLKFKTEIILLTGTLPGVRNIQDLLADGCTGYDEKTLYVDVKPEVQRKNPQASPDLPALPARICVAMIRPSSSPPRE